MNSAPWDRILRVVIGIALLSIVFIGPQTPWGWLGAILVITGLTGFCPLYRMFGLSTRPHPPHENAPKTT